MATKTRRSTKSATPLLPDFEIVGGEAIRPLYANFAQLATTNHDFRISFAEAIVATNERRIAREVGRVYLTPLIAKLLLRILEQGVANFEKANGEIQLPSPQPQKP